MVLLSDRLSQLSRVAVETPPLFVISRSEFSHEQVTIDNELVEVVSVTSPANPPSSNSTSMLVRMASQIHVFRVGVMFAANSCCASGVNNVLAGLWEHLCDSGKMFQLVGILGGPGGLAAQATLNLDSERELVEGLKNLGGTELLGYGSFTKDISLESLRSACLSLDLTSLVIVAASDELPQSVSLSNLLPEVGITTTIVPQSRNQHVFIPGGICSTSLGFDSARRVLAELAGNIAVDCLASKKYWHFINAGDAQLVGEVGMLVRANMIVTEADPEVTLKEWIARVVQLVEDRLASGLRSGVVMVSQCAFTRTKEMELLREEIMRIPAFPVPESLARKSLSKPSFALLEKLPKEVRLGLLRQRDDQGNPKLIYWSPEEFLVEEISAQLAKKSHSSQAAFRTHFLAHESRCPVPTAFDCVLGTCLGRTAASFVLNNMHGYMVTVKGLGQGFDDWIPCGVKINRTEAKVIRQRGYELTEPVREAWKRWEAKWRMESRYRSFGPLQIIPREALKMDEEFLPLSLMGNRKGGIESLLEGSGQPGEFRNIPGVSPPIKLPVRKPQDMSPLEQDRLEYIPKIPSYFSEPFAVVDSDICARASSADIETVFPHSSKLLPVELINVANLGDSEKIVSPSQPLAEIVIRKSSSVLLYGSECSDSDGEAPVVSARIESQIQIPLLERFEEICHSHGETLLSPRSSARVAPPAKPQLVRASDVCRRLGPRISVPAPPVTCQTGRSLSIESVDNTAEPIRVGIVFMCSQVPGCHNVVSGLFDYLGDVDGSRLLIGFLGGSAGLKKGWTQPLTADLVGRYRNQGGQDLLGHFGEPLSSDEDYNQVIKTIKQLGLNGLVIAGNLEGQLMAAVLTEKLLEKSVQCKVISVPVSAENEIPFVRQSVGYDTVTRVFSTTIANLWTECHSSRHRWYFVRLMSHHVSHLALECGLVTHPNIVLVTEEVAARQQSLTAITEMIADCICARSREGKDYGVVLIPDGVVAAVPQIRRLLRELDKIVGHSVKTFSGNLTVKLELVSAQLSMLSSVIFQQLPRFVQAHLVNGALRHAETGKIDIANVAMERILQSLVGMELEKRRVRGEFRGKVDLLVHSLAHQGRSSLPSSFDCDLAYTCGYASGVLLDAGKTGLVTNVCYSKTQSGDFVWSVGGFPAVALISISKLKDSIRISIEPTKLEMTGSACRALFASMPLPQGREGRHPGPLQWTANGTLSQLSEGNREQWESFEKIAAMCKEILSLVGEQVDKDPKVIDSVLRSLENILRFESGDSSPERRQLRSGKQFEEWFLNEPDDILSTCAPQKIEKH